MSTESPQGSRKKLTAEQRYINSETTKIFKEMCESVIVERLGAKFETQTPMNYLLGCHSRCLEDINKEKKKTEKIEETKIHFLEHLRSLIICYSGILLTEQGMFSCQPKSHLARQLIPHLTSSSTAYSSTLELSDDFLQDFTDHFKNNVTLTTVFTEVFTELSSMIRSITILDSYIPILTSMVRLTKYIELASILVKHPSWFPTGNQRNGAAMERHSILASFFTLTAYYDKHVVGEHYFGDGTLLTVKKLNEGTEQIRSGFKLIHDSLHKVVLNLLKPKETRSSILEWLSCLIEGNKFRARYHDDGQYSSSEGFMTNITVILLKLCEPFLKDHKKLASISSDFIMLNTSFNFKDDTKIAASDKEVSEYYGKKESKEFSFITQCFFLAYRSLKIGFLKTIDSYFRIIKTLGEAQRDLDRVSSTSGDAIQLKDEINKLWIIRWSAEVHLFDPQIHELILKFYEAGAMWTISKADPESKGYPLIPPPPMDFACIPEYFVDNISDYLLFTMKSCPSALSNTKIDSILQLFILLVGNGSYVHNPYVRAKIPEVLVAFIPSNRNSVPPSVVSAIFEHKLMKKHLMTGLMQVYVDVEHTGSSNQFYDRFNPRYFISLVLKYLWEYQEYKDAFVKATEKNNVKDFLRFFNMLLNDSIYLLDESLKSLQEIHQYQTDTANVQYWNSLPLTQRQERDAANIQDERKVSLFLLLARESVHMLNYLSRDVPTPFLRPEMIQRVATMLNYFLNELAGPQCQSLKVHNADRLHFDPKYLLTEITDTYVNFGKHDTFVVAVAEDERSFRPEVFEKTAQILRKIGKRSESYIKEFEMFSLKAMEEAAKLMKEDNDLGPIPDEYMDPITCALMEDPVRLPSSKVVIDRFTIERHLLNDPKDPFNRSPLKAEDLVPLPDLKREIEEWKKSKMKQ